MRTKNIGKVLLSLGLMFVLGSAITQVHGQDDKVPLITIHSAGDAVQRGKTGAFVLNMNPGNMLGGTYVNISVGGTARPGVDYVAIVSPAYIAPSGYGTILVQTLFNAGMSTQLRSVVVKLQPGPGYAVGEPGSAQIMIKP